MKSILGFEYLSLMALMNKTLAIKILSNIFFRIKIKKLNVICETEINSLLTTTQPKNVRGALIFFCCLKWSLLEFDAILFENLIKNSIPFYIVENL